jgi:hypothetical protein
MWRCGTSPAEMNLVAHPPSIFPHFCFVLIFLFFLVISFFFSILLLRLHNDSISLVRVRVFLHCNGNRIRLLLRPVPVTRTRRAYFRTAAQGAAFQSFELSNGKIQRKPNKLERKIRI